MTKNYTCETKMFKSKTANVKNKKMTQAKSRGTAKQNLKYSAMKFANPKTKYKKNDNRNKLKQKRPKSTKIN